MRKEPRWAELARYSAVFQAEFVVGLLQAHGIPARVAGRDVGIYGPGFQGPTLHGVRVLVPASQLEEARAVAGLEEAP